MSDLAVDSEFIKNSASNINDDIKSHISSKNNNENSEFFKHFCKRNIKKKK